LNNLKHDFNCHKKINEKMLTT